MSGLPKNGAPNGERCREHGAGLARVARGKELLLDDELYFKLAETFRTLADDTRAKIVFSLLHQDLCTCDLAAIVRLSEAAVSQHLRMLRHLRVVKSRREGKLVLAARSTREAWRYWPMRGTCLLTSGD